MSNLIIRIILPLNLPSAVWLLPHSETTDIERKPKRIHCSATAQIKSVNNLLAVYFLFRYRQNMKFSLNCPTWYQLIKSISHCNSSIANSIECLINRLASQTSKHLTNSSYAVIVVCTANDMSVADNSKYILRLEVASLLTILGKQNENNFKLLETKNKIKLHYLENCF